MQNRTLVPLSGLPLGEVMPSRVKPFARTLREENKLLLAATQSKEYRYAERLGAQLERADLRVSSFDSWSSLAGEHGARSVHGYVGHCDDYGQFRRPRCTFFAVGESHTEKEVKGNDIS